MAISSFEDLDVWKEGQNLAVEVYIATKQFPKDELFAMTNQLRRASSSISANIAEGFGRISKNELDKLLNQSVVCQKLINSFKTGVK